MQTNLMIQKITDAHRREAELKAQRSEQAKQAQTTMTELDQDNEVQALWNQMKAELDTIGLKNTVERMKIFRSYEARIQELKVKKLKSKAN